MKKKIVLIDGNSFCYRAFYAIKQLTTSQGQPTNAVYGFVTMLNKLIAEQRPDYLGVSFDLPGPTFRHQKFEDYKVQRKPMPDDLSTQIPIIKKVLQAYRVPIFEKKGYEADDVIATIASKLSSWVGNDRSGDYEIVVVTGDKDFLQITSDMIKVVNPHKDNQIMDAAWVKRHLGVVPQRIVDIMALAGDSSDNIPGVPGIGLATAIELIKEFGTLEELLANTQDIRSKSRAQKVKEFAQQAEMSRELARLDQSVPQIAQIPAEELLQSLKVKVPDKTALLGIFKELEFRSLLSELISEEKTGLKYEVVSERQAAEKIIEKIRPGKNVVVYPVITGHRLAKDLGSAAIVLAEEAKMPYYISFTGVPPESLKPVLENEKIAKTGHDLKQTKLMLAKKGVDLRGIGFDTMLAAYLLEPSVGNYTLADLALDYLDRKLADAQPIDQSAQARIACENADLILKLSRILNKKIAQVDMLALFRDLEMPLLDVLVEMEKAGVALDKDFLLDLSCEFDKKLKQLRKDIFEMSGEDFNINSPKQLGVILFEKLKLPASKRTKTGFSTDTEVLRKLARTHPIAESLLEFREVSKLKSTYVDGLIKLLDPDTKRIHTSFNQAATATGRLSSSQPNLQNIPIKTSLGRKIRQAFIASGKRDLLLSADYSQIELRILAHLSQDKNLVNAFKAGEDIHAYTASLIFGVEREKVKAHMRDTAKTVNFGIIYGISAYGLAKDLGIEQLRAQEFIDSYFQRYPGVKNYIDTQVKLAEKQGFVTTLLKRRRYLPQINSENENIRQFAQRAAINTAVQGSASDLIKTAMIEIYSSLKRQGWATQMLLQVHDELLFNVPEQELEKVSALIKDKMEHAIVLKVPLEVSIKSGKNWMEME